jgi:hypothetical protein
MKVVDFKPRMLDSMKDAPRYLRELADRIESGLVTELIVVSNQSDDGHVYEKYGAWEDRWRILGALEDAKGRVYDG